MRANAIVGNTTGKDYFCLVYNNSGAQPTYSLQLMLTAGTIGTPAVPVVKNLDGSIDTTSNGLLKANQTAILDFGELGIIELSITSDTKAADFHSAQSRAIFVTEHAKSANGGTLKFNFTEEQKKQLAAIVDASGAVGRDQSVNMIWVMTLQLMDTLSYKLVVRQLRFLVCAVLQRKLVILYFIKWMM